MEDMSKFLGIFPVYIFDLVESQNLIYSPHPILPSWIAHIVYSL